LIERFLASEIAEAETDASDELSVLHREVIPICMTFGVAVDPHK
jgi:hypothetical protein